MHDRFHKSVIYANLLSLKTLASKCIFKETLCKPNKTHPGNATCWPPVCNLLYSARGDVKSSSPNGRGIHEKSLTLKPLRKSSVDVIRRQQHEHGPWKVSFLKYEDWPSCLWYCSVPEDIQRALLAPDDCSLQDSLHTEPEIWAVKSSLDCKAGEASSTQKFQNIVWKRQYFQRGLGSVSKRQRTHQTKARSAQNRGFTCQGEGGPRWNLI